jgi:hypothetical protein
MPFCIVYRQCRADPHPGNHIPLLHDSHFRNFSECEQASVQNPSRRKTEYAVRYNAYQICAMEQFVASVRTDAIEHCGGGFR